MTIIVGAGLSGLIAAHAFPRSIIIEAEHSPSAAHSALLRFRSDIVSNLVGIPFRQVEVHKGIWYRKRFRQPTIRIANLYSKKVIDKLADRSIWSIKPVQRFIAPEEFYLQMIEACSNRISWSHTVSDLAVFRNEQVISTAPMPIMLNVAGITTPLEFKRAPIRVTRFRLKHSDVFQTIYFPDPEYNIYRASITGNLLIIEEMERGQEGEMEGQAEVFHAFGNPDVDHVIGATSQKFGKIDPVDDATRKALMFQLTHQHNVFSLGRFGTWRNILLDDVVKDIAVIRRMMTSTAYDQHRQINS